MHLFELTSTDIFYTLNVNESLRQIIILFLIYTLSAIIAIFFIKNVKTTFIIAPFIALFLIQNYVVPQVIGVYTVLIFAVFLFFELKKNGDNDETN